MDFDQYGQPAQDKNLPNVTFYNEARHDPAASKREGRPIYHDVEMVNIAFPADRQRTLVRPAKSEWKKIKGEIVTYVDRFPEQYRRFKANEPQLIEGTPLSEAPFLTAAQRATLKALNVHTVEQLASLQGQALKNLGAGGLAQQQAAAAYLENAKGTANVTAQAEEIARLKTSIEALSAQGSDPRMKFVDMGDDKLKDFIKEKSGAAPRGNPSRQTLVRMAVELDAGRPIEEEAA